MTDVDRASRQWAVSKIAKVVITYRQNSAVTAAEHVVAAIRTDEALRAALLGVPSSAPSSPVGATEPQPGTPGHPDPALAQQERRARYEDAIIGLHEEPDVIDAAMALACAELADLKADRDDLLEIVGARGRALTKVERQRDAACAELADLKAEVAWLTTEVCHQRAEVDRLTRSLLHWMDTDTKVRKAGNEEMLRADTLRVEVDHLRTEATWAALAAETGAEQAAADLAAAKAFSLMLAADLTERDGTIDRLWAQLNEATEHAGEQRVLGAIMATDDQATERDALREEVDRLTVHVVRLGEQIHRQAVFVSGQVRLVADRTEERDEARMWARHGYEIGQRSCTWSDQGVAPNWLTEGHKPESLRGTEHHEPMFDPFQCQTDDEPCDCRACVMQAERDEARAALERVQALLPKWLADRATYPLGNATGASVAFLAVKACEEELAAALDAPTEPAPGLEVPADAPTRNAEFPVPTTPDGYGLWLSTPLDEPATASDRLAATRDRLTKAMRGMET